MTVTHPFIVQCKVSGTQHITTEYGNTLSDARRQCESRINENWFLVTDEVAIRSFTEMVLSEPKPTQISNHHSKRWDEYNSWARIIQDRL